MHYSGGFVAFDNWNMENIWFIAILIYFCVSKNLQFILKIFISLNYTQMKYSQIK